MKRIAVYLAAMFLLLTGFTLNVWAAEGDSQLEVQMLELVNEEREKAGLEPLVMEARLVDLARLKSLDMIEKNYFNHTSPTYGDPFAMMEKYGVEYWLAGENLAGNSSVAGAHEALMNSPGHRANILKPDFTHVGIGIVKGGPYGIMFTQMFIKARGETTEIRQIAGEDKPKPAVMLPEGELSRQEPAQEEIKVIYNNKDVVFPDIKPYINDQDRVMVPIRFVSQELGFKVNWEVAGQAIIIKKGENVITLKVGKNIILKNNLRYISDSIPELFMGRTVVPLRMVSELLDSKVIWHPTLKKVTIQ
ncbi:MAG: stalk domain-containing protein [Bacillota bacterium]